MRRLSNENGKHPGSGLARERAKGEFPMNIDRIWTRAARGTAALLCGVLLAAASTRASAGPPNYAPGDMLYVVYSPAGDEIVVDIGPTSSFENLSACLSLPLAGHPLSAADVTDVLG